jgi:hypothetical protein
VNKTATPMMGCGHRANGITGTGEPCCVICYGVHAESITVVGEPDLTGRMARCSCGKTVPSDASEYRLAFFEYRGPGSRQAVDSCKNCGYSKVAHTQEPTRTQQNVVFNGKCSGFEPRGAMEFDTYYCGCRGWD